MSEDCEIIKCVFIHGLGQDSSSWQNTISLMNGSIRMDCPDFSDLLRNEETSYANLYCAFSAYCDAIPEPVNLCGLSLGGVLALHYAIDHPVMVNSLVLIGTQYKMPKAMLKIQNVIFRLMPESTFNNTGFQKKDLLKLTNSMTDLDFSKELTGNAFQRRTMSARSPLSL